MGGNIFSFGYDLYGKLLPRHWIKSLWKFAHGDGISLPTLPTKDLEGDLTKTEITIEYVYISMQKSINIW